MDALNELRKAARRFVKAEHDYITGEPRHNEHRIAYTDMHEALHEAAVAYVITLLKKEDS